MPFPLTVQATQHAALVRETPPSADTVKYLMSFVDDAGHSYGRTSNYRFASHHTLRFLCMDRKLRHAALEQCRVFSAGTLDKLSSRSTVCKWIWKSLQVSSSAV